MIPTTLPRQSEGDLENRVITIFEKNCTNAGCHSGSYPQLGLDLTKGAFYGTTVNKPSVEKPQMKRIKPGAPDSSYLVMKILGSEDITGLRMPFGKDPLSEEEIAVIVDWVKNMSTMDESRVKSVKSQALLPFSGWKVVNIPTTRTVDTGIWLFLIGHRFLPRTNDGYSVFYGLDGSANIFLNLGYALSDKLFINLGRSNLQDNIEFDVRYGIKKQVSGDKLPVAIAIQASGNWLSEKREGEDRLHSDVLKFTGQAMLSHQLRDGLSFIVVPGILINPDSKTKSEDPLITIGLGGKIHLYKSVSIVAEWSPIVSGYILTESLGNFNRFDTWASGIELAVGGHVFQIIATNSTGLTTDQYMRGGDLDIRDGDFRIGFNIFRMLEF
jgi:hypothetical protein